MRKRRKRRTKTPSMSTDARKKHVGRAKFFELRCFQFGAADLTLMFSHNNGCFPPPPAPPQKSETRESTSNTPPACNANQQHTHVHCVKKVGMRRKPVRVARIRDSSRVLYLFHFSGWTAEKINQMLSRLATPTRRYEARLVAYCCSSSKKYHPATAAAC